MSRGNEVQRYERTSSSSRAGDALAPSEYTASVGDLAFTEPAHDWRNGLTQAAMAGLRKRGIEQATGLFGSTRGRTPTWVVTWSGGIRSRPNGVYIISVGADGHTRLRCLAQGRPHDHKRVSWYSLSYRSGAEQVATEFEDVQRTPGQEPWLPEHSPAMLTDLVSFPSSLREYSATRQHHEGLISDTIQGFAVGRDVVVFQIARTANNPGHHFPDELLAQVRWRGHVWRLNLQPTTR